MHALVHEVAQLIVPIRAEVQLIVPEARHFSLAALVPLHYIVVVGVHILLSDIRELAGHIAHDESVWLAGLLVVLQPSIEVAPAWNSAYLME